MSDNTMEIRSYPFKIGDDVDIRLPEVIELLGIESRPKAGVSITLYLVALVRPGTAEKLHKFRLGCEGMPIKSGFLPRPVGNCRVEKPRPVTYWLFDMLPDP